MQLTAVHLARVSAWVEVLDLNPRGTVPYPFLVEKLIERYNFQTFPQKPEDFDETKGVKFEGGFYDGTVIEQLIIYTYGVLLDTRKNTADSKRLLEDAFQWASNELGLYYKPTMVKHWQYASGLAFESEANLTAINPAAQMLCSGLTEAVQRDIGEHLPYEVTAIIADFDQLTRRHPLGRFSIQRRDNTHFSDNKYFSDAPLQTATHIQLLEDFETALLKK